MTMLTPVHLGNICGGVHLNLRNDQRTLSRAISAKRILLSSFSGNASLEGPIRLLEVNYTISVSVRTVLNDR